MNLKERFDIFNVNNMEDDKKNLQNCISNFFEKNLVAELVIKNELDSSSNVLLVSQKAYDKNIFCEYIKSLTNEKESVVVLRSFHSSIQFIGESKIIIPEPSTQEILRVLECILGCFQSFIFSINIKSFEEILDSLKTILMINSPNLNIESIEYLLAKSKLTIIFFDKNEDGIFSVKNVAKIVESNDELALEHLYVHKEQDVIIEPPKTIEVVLESDTSTTIIVENEFENSDVDIDSSCLEVAGDSVDVSDNEQENLVSDEQYENTPIVTEEKIDEIVDNNQLEPKALVLNRINKNKLLKLKMRRKSKVNKLE